MPPPSSNPWQPDPRKLGNWTSMFEPERGGAPSTPHPASGEPPRDDEAVPLDPSVYRPWTLQRGRSRAVVMLDLRRFEPRSGLWMGWQLAYAHLVAIDYIGDRMLALDFGGRQFVIEGYGLDELARHFQQGTVMAVVEYAPALWPQTAAGGTVHAIRKVDSRPKDDGGAD